ncbi:MAG: c-type cytochrome [Lysobacter sp.]
MAFWVIKHGIKASGMPAWGESMADEYIWNMAAFLQVLPTLDEAEYQAMVANSGGHSHGGSETEPHPHGEGVAANHHDDPAAGLAAVGASTSHDHPPGTQADHHETDAQPEAPPQMSEHCHADGTVESQPAPPTPRPTTATITNTDHGASEHEICCNRSCPHPRHRRGQRRVRPNPAGAGLAHASRTRSDGRPKH